MLKKRGGKGLTEYDYLLNTSAVKTRTLELINVTPLLMHGWQLSSIRNGKEVNEPMGAEMRTASVKGVLRYWWRALQHAQDIKVLLNQEKQLFGGVGGVGGVGDDAGSSSKLLLKFTGYNAVPRHKSAPALICPHSNRPFKAPAFPENNRFKLVMSVAQKDKKLFEELEHYIEIIFMVAGFGQRSRRGAGAIQLAQANWSNRENFQDDLKELLSKLGKSAYYLFPAGSSNILSMDTNAARVEYPTLANVWIGSPHAQGEQTRTAISKAGHLANPSQGGAQQYLGSARGGRKASPLHATVRKIGDKYYPVVSEVNTNQESDNKNYLKARDNFLQVLGVR
jgi:CRISPR-associated protein Cmr1